MTLKRVYEIADWKYVKIIWPNYLKEYTGDIFEAKRIDKTHWKKQGKSKYISNTDVMKTVNAVDEIIKYEEKFDVRMDRIKIIIK